MSLLPIPAHSPPLRNFEVVDDDGDVDTRPLQYVLVVIRSVHLFLVLPLIDLVDRADGLDGRPQGPQDCVAVLYEILPRFYTAPA